MKSLAAILLALWFSANAQRPVTTIIFKYKKEAYPLDSYWFKLKKPLLDNAFGDPIVFSGKMIAQNSENDSCMTRYEYQINRVTCASLADLLGHEIILIPGDTLVVHIGKENKAPIAGASGTFVRQWLHELSYSGTHPFVYAIFDSLANFNGDLRNGSSVRLSKTAITLDSFCNAVNSQYLSRLQYIEKYSKLHVVPARVQCLVKAEVYSSYMNNLIQPMLGWGKKLDDYPPKYASIIRHAKFRDPELYFNTRLYSMVAANLFALHLDEPFSGADSTPKELIGRYTGLKKSSYGKIRDHQITAYLDSTIPEFQKSPGVIDSILKDFRTYGINKNYINYLDSTIAEFINRKEVIYTMEQAMAAEISDPGNSKRLISSLFKNKNVLLICWASWCKPCIEEFPFEKRLEKKYKGQIAFVYLSFDHNRADWQAKCKELNIKKRTYLLTDGFKSDIARYYKINSIPRYFIYNKETREIKMLDTFPSEWGGRSVLGDLAK